MLLFPETFFINCVLACPQIRKNSFEHWPKKDVSAKKQRLKNSICWGKTMPDSVLFLRIMYLPKQCKEHLQKFTREMREVNTRIQTLASSKYNCSVPIPTSLEEHIYCYRPVNQRFHAHPSSYVLILGPHFSLFTSVSENTLPNAYRHDREYYPCHSESTSGKSNKGLHKQEIRQENH